MSKRLIEEININYGNYKIYMIQLIIKINKFPERKDLYNESFND